MKFIMRLFPFAFRKNDLAKYTKVMFWLSLSLVLSCFLATLFVSLGSWWGYVSIPFWIIFAYDLLSATLATLCFLEWLPQIAEPKGKKPSAPKPLETESPLPPKEQTASAEEGK